MFIKYIWQEMFVRRPYIVERQKFKKCVQGKIMLWWTFYSKDLFSPFQSPTPPQYVFWYHNNRMINYDTTRGSTVTVQTDSSSTQSRLTIHHAVESDTGNYTCSASNTKPASIYVFVTEGIIFKTIKIFFLCKNKIINFPFRYKTSLAQAICSKINFLFQWNFISIHS